MKIGIVCPYAWDIPGGVQAHVRDLAEIFIERGHQVAVLAPGEDEIEGRPAYLTTAGKPLPIRYNGSVARLQFGVVSAARVRRWLKDGDFDVVHVQEPIAPSISFLTCVIHDGPMVATFHVSTTRSRALAALENVVQPFLEKLSGRIAVSEAARKVIVEHLGADAVVIPNGVAVAHFRDAEPLPGYPREGGTIGFVGRYDEPRKGMVILLRAFEKLIADRPGLRLVVAGRGDAEEFLESLPETVRSRIDLLGQVSEEDKARMLRSVDVYCAPNTGGESFGIILLEAMSAGTPVVASDLAAFKRVLAGGKAGELFHNRNSDQLAEALARVLDDADLRKRLVDAGSRAVQPYDWSGIADQVLRVYELAIGSSAGAPAR